jgi:hypothetical protein
MAKIDKSKYSKEEIKAMKAAKRERKAAKLLKNSVKTFPTSKDKNILVLKHGQKYSADYVNKMYNMVTANLEYDFNFYCITEDPNNLNPKINVIPLPTVAVTGWWYKPYIFSADLPIEGTILYLDLDLVVTNSLNRLFDFYPGEYCIIRDFTRSMRPNWEKYNSSVIRFEKGQLDYVWQRFKKEHLLIMRKFYGDQDYLWEATQGKAKVFPDPWVRSWKWEVRKDKRFKPGQTRGHRELQDIEHVKAPDDCCIVAFHGDPNPHNCHDPYIVEKWV